MSKNKKKKKKDKHKQSSVQHGKIPKAKDEPKVTTTYTAYSGKKQCHTDPCEIIKGLWIGSHWSVDDMVKTCSTIVPLSDSDGDIWDTWRGELLYVPITDYQSLPIDVLQIYAMKVAEKIIRGETVGVHCMGGHGRTGYFASAVLWLLEVPQLAGYTDPVKYIREKYCKKAIESAAQLKSLGAFTGISNLHKLYEESKVPLKSYWKYGKDTDPCDSYYWDDWVESARSYNDPVKSDYSDYALVEDHPCNDCLYAYETKVKGGYQLQCELGNNMESVCVEFFPWDEYDEYVGKKREVIEGEIVGESKGASGSKATIKY